MIQQELLQRDYDIFHGVWRYFWKEEFSYDSLNLLIKKDRFDYFSLNNWRPELRDLYFYDANRNNTENIRQEWNSTDSTWINDYRYLYEYDLNNLLLSVVYQRLAARFFRLEKCLERNLHIYITKQNRNNVQGNLDNWFWLE